MFLSSVGSVLDSFFEIKNTEKSITKINKIIIVIRAVSIFESCSYLEYEIIRVGHYISMLGNSKILTIRKIVHI